MTTNIFANFTRPGTKVVESTQGYRSLELASHQAVYMIGSSASGDYLNPTQVTSLVDFTNVFGASPSEASVKLFFRNDKRGILYFVRTPIAKRFKITVTTAAAGAYTTTINGTAVTYTAPASPTPTLASVASGLLAAINNSSVADAVSAVAGEDTDELIVRADNPLATLTVVVTGSNITVTEVTPTTPTSVDYIYAIENSFDVDDEWAQGFLIAPQAFQALTVQSDRLALGNAMEALASDASFDWVALIDMGANLTIAEVQVEAALYASAQGHSSVYYPYLTDLEDATVPPSAGVAGLATRAFKEEGFQQPPAGAKFPVLGVKDVVTKVNNAQQDVLNPLRINVIRNLRNKGVVVWAMRTRSTNEFYKFVHTRVIMNVLNGTLRKGFDNELFSIIDGQGILLNNISQTAYAVCSRLWRGKALFGATEAEAFEVKCDFENNTPEELEQGNVLLEVYAVPAPALEKLLISTIRVSIGTLPLNQNQLESQVITGQVV
ncbi:phage tail sheath subtilisin-like domain-containing protein [Nostoc sp. UHCC 0870]|uniref:phage tail sheath subtilisin-like domain-containing protein n=1 Tax=Nostoc sp. UHCC 0870 TaxID=2914041 RepID=UPI001EE005FE|nr:phage tail sheath subtilisin-like domain-containing protein [Nostoc sp. UHCC 0870]UKO99364.1 phage tail sheath subtilisin-like domain-containing protein [Nostoc sp. UHCC 0870]